MTRTAIALVLLLSSAVRAEDVAAYLAKLDQKYYSDAGAGLKDFSVAVVRSSWAGAGWKDAKARLSWKAPDRKRARIEGAPADAAKEVAAQQADVEQLADEIITESWAQEAEQYSFTLSEEEGKKKLVGTPKKGAADAEEIVSWTLVFGAEDVLQTSEIAMKDGSKQLDTFTWTQKDGKSLMESRTGRVIDPSTGEPTGHNLVKVEYDKVGGFWLPSKITEESATKETWTLSDYKVNSGLDDATFEK